MSTEQPIPSPFPLGDEFGNDFNLNEIASDETLDKIRAMLGNPQGLFIVLVDHAGECSAQDESCDGHSVKVVAKNLTPPQVHGLLHGMIDDFHHRNPHMP